MHTLTCSHCGTTFERTHRRDIGSVYCSTRCRSNHHSSKAVSGEPIGFGDNIKARKKAERADDAFAKAMERSSGSFEDAVTTDDGAFRMARPETEVFSRSSMSGSYTSPSRAAGRPGAL